MNLRYLLDTNIVSELTRPWPRAHVLQRLDEHDGSLAMASVTLHELRYGLSLLPDSRRRQDLEAHLLKLLQRLPVRPYDARAASWHGVERARLWQLGQTPPFADGQIAATAVTQGLILVTANTNDFLCFDGLQLEDWTQPATTPR